MFTIDEAWLAQYGIDIFDFQAALEAQNLDPEPNEDGQWIFEAADENGDNIPDFLASLVTVPVETRPSQGGAMTNP